MKIAPANHSLQWTRLAPRNYWRSGFARCMVGQRLGLHPPRHWARPLGRAAKCGGCIRYCRSAWRRGIRLG